MQIEAYESGGSGLNYCTHDGTQGDVFFACISYYNGGGSCTQGSYTNPNPVGHVETDISEPAAWSGRYSTDGYYLYADLGCPHGSGGNDSLFSYRLTN